MADEFEQFRKRSYHGGYDVGMCASATFNVIIGDDRTFSRQASRGPPLKRSRSHPVGASGKFRRAVRPTACPELRVTGCEEQNEKSEALPQAETVQDNGSEQHEAQKEHLLNVKGALNNALHSSLHSLVLLPKINEYLESHLCPRIPHHSRVFPMPTSASRRSRPTATETSNRSVSRSSSRTPKLTKRTSLQSCDQTGPFSVRIVGQQGVGKATLVRTFASADESYSADSEDYSDGASVSVSHYGKDDLLMLTVDADWRDPQSNGPADAFVVVYAVNDKHSFEEASRTVRSIRSKNDCRDVPIVMVANKGDIVRNRSVKTKVGRDLANKHKCKYVEVSALLNINVDELFLGVLSQMYFARERLRQKVASDSNMVVHHRRRPLIKAMGYLGKLFAKYIEYENDIDNLFAP